MQLLKRWFDFYVFSNIHVAVATFSLTKISLLYCNVTANELPLFVFFATLLSYNFIRLYRKSEIKSWFNEWIHAHERYLMFSIIVSIGALIYLVFQLRITTLMALIPLGVLTLLYVVPLPGKISLRALSGIKLFLIAFCWAVITVVLPVINHEVPVSKDIFLVFLQRLFFVAAITIPFDIRDVQYDSDAMKTLPKVLGIAKVKRLGMLFLMFFLGLNFLKISPSEMLRVDFLVALLSLFLLVRSTQEQNKYYSAFFVEAVPIVWLLLILI